MEENENKTESTEQPEVPPQKPKDAPKKKRFNILNPFGNAYKEAKEDSEKRNKSVKFGWFAILYSALCIGAVYPCMLLGVKGVVYGFTHYLGFFTVFLLIGNAIIVGFSMAFALFPYYLWIHGAILVFRQLSLNRRLIGWLALLVWLASLIGIFWLSIESFVAIVS